MNSADGLTIAIIIARLNSSRLPKKHLRLINGKPMIDHIINRLRQVQNIDKVVLATGPSDENAPLGEHVHNLDVETFYDNDVNDVTGRIARAAKFFEAKYVVTVSGDCPLIDTNYIRTGIKLLIDSKTDYVFIDYSKYECLHEGIEFHTTENWEKLDELSSTWYHKEHPGSVLNGNNGLFYGVEIVPHENFRRHDFRMSVDTRSDLLFVDQVYKELATGSDIIDLHDVVNLIDIKPWIKNINSHVHQKKVSEKSKVILLITQTSSGIGMGHLSRCLALATELQESFGAKTIFYVNSDPTICNILDKQGFLFHSENQFGHRAEIDQLIARYGINGMVLDLKKEVLHKQFSFIKECVVSSILIDNHPVGPFKDLVAIIPAVKINEDPPQENIFTGKHFLILKREIQYWREKKDLPSPNGILIMSGGSNLPTDELLKAITHIDYTIPITLVIGPFADRGILERNLKSTGIIKYNIIQSPDEIFKEIKKAKLVLLPFGVTAYECIALGVPVYIYDIINPNDEKIVQYMACNNLLFNGLDSSSGVNSIGSQINGIYHNNAVLEKMKKCALEYTDGLGVYNVASIINDMFATRLINSSKN